MKKEINFHSKDLMTRDEVLQLLQISNCTLNWYIRLRMIPHYRYVKIQFSKHDIFKHIIHHRVNTCYETSVDAINNINNLISNMSAL